MAETLTDYDKFIVKHLQALQWLESLNRDYEANHMKIPAQLVTAELFLKHILNEVGKKEMVK